ncbi:hypothetical protein ONS95_011359 [Cadophora gregata]|uniref:uncharacterized protein n=1 Tax=Cadophora gregata TaxID=51156 RepID=UPI0026DBEE27|nr:uncharacterized protein ONS95_011359 [Cadophora gregata]KAK0119934.1 hypothetical protein ONS95_011359 [Cadophora gregata]KAK0120967.1 hypothetical protein ONS96_011162 [Cadophora gregata f. sp. sojae]
MAHPVTAFSRLLGLADELLIQIIYHLDDPRSLCNLAATCSRLQGLAEAALYNTILIRKGYRALDILASILGRLERALLIRKLHVRYLYDNSAGIETLNITLQHLTQLKELLIEAPCCNDTHAIRADFESEGKINYAAYFDFASSMTLGPQPRVQVPLETFTLHSHNKQGSNREVFDLGKNSIIFRHPTLQNLKISCFDVGDNVEVHLSASQNSTVLKSLTFDECNITVMGLAAILSVPKGLERLILGERMYHVTSNHEPLGRFPAEFLKALAIQERSLQYLKHVGGRYSVSHASANLSMTNFSSLREMELESQSILTRILSDTAPPWMPTMPPDLSLRITFRSWQLYLEDDDDIWFEPLSAIIEWLGRVSYLDFIVDFGERNDMETIVPQLWKGKHGRKQMKQILSLLGHGQKQKSTQGRRLRIFNLKWSGFIPPYMYGEQEPREELAFDSALYQPERAGSLEEGELSDELSDELAEDL